MAAVVGLIACAGDRAGPTGDEVDSGSSDASDVADSAVPDAADAADVADSHGADADAPTGGWLGDFWLVGGALLAGPIAVTTDGWALLLTANQGRVTGTHGDAVLPIAPEGDGGRLLVMPVDRDGRPQPAVEVGVGPMAALHGGLRRCGDSIWGGASTTTTSWLFRAPADDLSDLTVARFEALGEPATQEGEPGPVARVGEVACVGSDAAFVVNVTQGMRVLPPHGEAFDIEPVARATWLLADGRALLDEGRLDATGDGHISTLRAGAGGTVLFTEVDVNPGAGRGSSRILRHDFATGATTPFVDVVFPREVYSLRFAEDTRDDGASGVGGFCVRGGGELDLGDVSVSNPGASDVCAIVSGGAVTAALAMERIGLVAFDDGLFWLSGQYVGGDPLLGPAVGTHDAFLLGFDPATMSVVARAHFGAPDTSTGARALMPIAGEGACAGRGTMGLEVSTVAAGGLHYSAGGRPDSRISVVQAGPGGTGCHDAVGVVIIEGTYLFIPSEARLSHARPGPCAGARRLAALTPGARVAVGAEITPRILYGGFGLVAFEPETCSMTPRPLD